MTYGKAETKSDPKEMYSGKIDGLTFERFDDKVISWGRSRWGDKYATALWQDDLIKVGDLDLTDDLDYFAFEGHCEAQFYILSLVPETCDRVVEK